MRAIVPTLKEISEDKAAKDEIAVLNGWLTLNGEEASLRKRLNEAEAALDGGIDGLAVIGAPAEMRQGQTMSQLQFSK